jgi:hypothetical protein
VAATRRAETAQNNNHFCFSRTRVFRFFSQEKIFAAMKNKIHFFLVDFESDF